MSLKAGRPRSRLTHRMLRVRNQRSKVEGPNVKGRRSESPKSTLERQRSNAEGGRSIEGHAEGGLERLKAC